MLIANPRHRSSSRIRFRLICLFTVICGFACHPPALAVRLGYETIGPSQQELAGFEIAGNVFIATESFYAETVTFHLNAPSDPTHPDPYCSVAVYSVVGGVPADLLGYHYRDTNTFSNQWNTVALDTPVTITAGQSYYVCISCDISYQNLSLDTSLSAPRFHQDNTVIDNYPDPAAPITQTSGTYSIYLEGPALSSSATFTRTASPTWTPTFTATRTHTPTYTITPTRTVTSTITPTPTYTVTLVNTLTATPTFSPTLTPLPVIKEDFLVYPSPASGSTVWFHFRLARPGRVDLCIYNLAGEKGASFAYSFSSAGSYRTTWDIRNVAGGMYFCRAVITFHRGQQDLGIRKLVIVKDR